MFQTLLLMNILFHALNLVSKKGDAAEFPVDPRAELSGLVTNRAAQPLFHVGVKALSGTLLGTA